MPVSLTLDLNALKAAADSFSGSLQIARDVEQRARQVYNDAKENLDKALADINTYSKLLEQANRVLEMQKSLHNASNPESEVELDSSKITRRRRKGQGIDATTFQLLVETGSPQTADSLAVLVASELEGNISHKSVRNALGEFVKEGRISKHYSKVDRIYLYGLREWFKTDILFEDASSKELVYSIMLPHKPLGQIENQIDDQTSSPLEAEEDRY